MNSNPGGVAQLATTAGSAESRTFSIAVGQSRSPGSVAFDPLLAGTVDVRATSPGYGVVPGATQTVTVNP